MSFQEKEEAFRALGPVKELFSHIHRVTLSPELEITFYPGSNLLSLERNFTINGHSFRVSCTDKGLIVVLSNTFSFFL